MVKCINFAYSITLVKKKGHFDRTTSPSLVYKIHLSPQMITGSMKLLLYKTPDNKDAADDN